MRYFINDLKVDVNPQTLEKTPLYIATQLNQERLRGSMGPTYMDSTQEQLIGELLKAGAVYEQQYTFPVNFGPNEPLYATSPEDEAQVREKMEERRALIKFNDKLSEKINEFVKASSIYINEIKIVKYNPVLLAYFRKKFEPELDDRDVMEIMKYI